MSARRVTVYRSDRVRDLYVFIDAQQTLAVLPQALRQRMGPSVAVLTLELAPGRRMARSDASHVLAQIERLGFYLQLPPEPERPRTRPDRAPEP